MDAFLEALYTPCDDTDAQLLARLEQVYDTLDALLLEGRLSDVQEWLAAVDLERVVSPTLLIGLCTFAALIGPPAAVTFVDAVGAHLHRRGCDADELLRGFSTLRKTREDAPRFG